MAANELRFFDADEVGRRLPWDSLIEVIERIVVDPGGDAQDRTVNSVPVAAEVDCETVDDLRLAVTKLYNTEWFIQPHGRLTPRAACTAATTPGGSTTEQTPTLSNEPGLTPAARPLR